MNAACLSPQGLLGDVGSKRDESGKAFYLLFLWFNFQSRICKDAAGSFTAWSVNTTFRKIIIGPFAVGGGLFFSVFLFLFIEVFLTRPARQHSIFSSGGWREGSGASEQKTGRKWLYYKFKQTLEKNEEGRMETKFLSLLMGKKPKPLRLVIDSQTHLYWSWQWWTGLFPLFQTKKLGKCCRGTRFLMV